MTQTVTATYNDSMKAVNAYDELISKDFPREKLFLDRDTNVVKVIVPDPGQREAEEILNRHEPDNVEAKPYQD
ncbi:hypothetical protein [Vreelandella massiliensis]|uniref:hypothetical protein n=1 Tax=Vreelandella massiliensis TaxID=1816686 RepID=UPI00096A50EA|nr:hypothetical protein [Halomonas massiliensis]MYL23090.1 hypothetical protein [Halomonas alkaliantarctica]